MSEACHLIVVGAWSLRRNTVGSHGPRPRAFTTAARFGHRFCRLFIGARVPLRNRLRRLNHTMVAMCLRVVVARTCRAGMAGHPRPDRWPGNYREANRRSARRPHYHGYCEQQHFRRHAYQINCYATRCLDNNYPQLRTDCSAGGSSAAVRGKPPIAGGMVGAEISSWGKSFPRKSGSRFFRSAR
jgi:hypothetical protein